MKRLRKNSGFTLVECIVAMAVLAVVTLCLMMILNVTVKQRNSNIQIEQNIDSQVEQVVQGSGTATEEITADIDLGGGYTVSGAKKIYFDDSEAEFEVGQLDFASASSSYKKEEDNNNNNNNNDITSKHENPLDGVKVYGALETLYVDTWGTEYDGYIDVSEQSAVDTDGVTTAVWTVTFTTVGGQGTLGDEKSVKLDFPSAAKLVSYEIISERNNVYFSNCTVHKLSKNAIRIQPEGDRWTTDQKNIMVDIEFTISTDSYQKPEDYFGSGDTKIKVNTKY